jgi:hypothetical protein
VAGEAVTCVEEYLHKCQNRVGLANLGERVDRLSETVGATLASEKIIRERLDDARVAQAVQSAGH